MTCTTCGAANEAGSRFCDQCGSALEATCHACGGTLGAGARFCRSCGTPVADTAASPAAAPAGPADPASAVGQPGPAATVSRQPAATERRLVTVLFADLVGFTSLAEDRDPESTRELLTRYFDAARAAIERHGGTIEKFIGDAVMAVWGTPVAHEDDAERAVRAALELVDAVKGLVPQHQLQARAGLMTGEVAVTLGAINQGMVAGDLVNTAARLQGVAEPGTVLAGAATVRAAEAAILFETVGDRDLKGKLSPVPAWRAVRIVAARGGLQRNEALEPPFVGRDDELRLLKDQLHATARDQRTRLVSITGPGGIGKSRLVWELEKYVDGLTEAIYWHRGRSPSYGEGITFWALGEMVRRRARLSEDDDETATRARIRETVEEYVTDPAERQLVEPALLTLLGLDAGDGAAADDAAAAGDGAGAAAGGGRDRLFPAWRIFFERIAERGTTALVFEDLQWADSGLLDFIDHLLDWSKSRPLLVITLARPELFERRPDWGAGRRTLAALALDPLSDEHMRQLLEGVVPGVPAEAVETIVSRAEGIPLYAVETVRMLLAEGRIERDGDVYRPVGDLANLSVPQSLRALIGSRLDALEPADRALVQDASVLGQVFTAATLAVATGTPEAELEPRLRSLVRRELLEVEADPASPERGRYRFVQGLIREVAYGTLALRDRRSRHLAVARHYESLGDEELAGALANHYLSAFEASAEGAEADAVAAQARIALRAAANRAAALGAQTQALAHLERALPLADDPTERADLLERAALAAFHAATGDAERHARAAVEARREAGDPVGVDRTTALLAHVLLDQNELDAAVELLEGAFADADRERDPRAEAELQVALARAYMRLGRNEEALARTERALALAELNGLDQVLADGLNTRAAVLTRWGRYKEAVALQEAAIELASAGGWVDLELRLRYNLAILVADNDPSRARRHGREVLEIAQRIGSTPWFTRGVAMSAGQMIELPEQWDESLDVIADALARLGDQAPHHLVGLRAFLLTARGGPVADALRELDALPAAAAHGHDAAVELHRAEIVLTGGDMAAAERHAQRALELDETGELAPWALNLLMRVSLKQRDAARARDVLERMQARASRGAQSLIEMEQLDGGILALEGRTDEARAKLGRSIEASTKLEQHFQAAMTRLIAVRLLPEAPEAPAWAQGARSLFERAGAKAYLKQLDEAVAAMPASVRPAPAVAPPSEVPASAS